MVAKLNVKITMEGSDWKLFNDFIKYEWARELESAVGRATGRAANFILAEIRRRIRDKEYVPNTEWTKAHKKTPGDDTPLVDTGRLIREALAVNQIKSYTWEVGILQNMKMSHDSTKTMEQIVPVLHEGATFTITRGGKRITIRIPPRPFLKRVWEDPKVVKEVQTIWHDAIEKVLKKHGKL